MKAKSQPKPAPKRRSSVHRDLRTPKYRQRVLPNKKKQQASRKRFFQWLEDILDG